MNLHKTKIEWATHTWNPVTGCLHGCDYCYARRFVERFKPHAAERPLVEPKVVTEHPTCYLVERPAVLLNEKGERERPTVYPKGFAPTFSSYTLSYPAKRLIPSRVFVSSMGDLFGEWVPDDWIRQVFEACLEAPQHTYLFLTKNPRRYIALANAGELPKRDNFWYGTTVTRPGEIFFGSLPFNTFLSIEPLTESLDAGIGSFGACQWIIVGAMTGPGSKEHQPRREWVENIVEAAGITHAAVFMKDSLREVWGKDLLREHPDGMVWPEGGGGK